MRYFISYNYMLENGVFGFGNLERNNESEIRNIKDIVKISRSIEKDLGYPEKSVAILNFVRFKGE